MIGVVATIAIGMVTIARYSALGASLATLLGASISLLLAYRYVGQKLKAVIPLKTLVRVSVSTAILSLVTTKFPQLNLLSLISVCALFSVSYLVLLWWTREFSTKEIALVKEHFMKFRKKVSGI
jgi:O-antigen/teichoic acid export membrane protein